MNKQWDYFTELELQCPCCKKAPMNDQFMSKLVKLRRELNFPLHITSGYRCASHNKKIGGAAASKHVLGRAVDIALTMPEKDQPKLLASAYYRGLYGQGVAKTFVHLDDYSPRLWGY